MARELSGDAVMAVCVDVMSRPWQWGVADCCTAACDVFERLHGVDPMMPLRGGYNDKSGATRAIAHRGGWIHMADDLAVWAGLEVAPVRGAAGDIALIRLEAGHALAVALGGNLFAGKSPDGLTMVEGAVRCWSMPRS